MLKRYHIFSKWTYFVFKLYFMSMFTITDYMEQRIWNSMLKLEINQYQWYTPSLFSLFLTRSRNYTFCWTEGGESQLNLLGVFEALTEAGSLYHSFSSRVRKLASAKYKKSPVTKMVILSSPNISRNKSWGDERNNYPIKTRPCTHPRHIWIAVDPVNQSPQ